jgi:hypothetical protein
VNPWDFITLKAGKNGSGTGKLPVKMTHGERRKRKKRKKRINLHDHPVVAWRRKEKREGRRRGRFGVERRKSSIFWLILFRAIFSLN